MSENKKILLVDDEADIALAFSLGLESHGFSVDAPGYGAPGFRMA